MSPEASLLVIALVALAALLSHPAVALGVALFWLLVAGALVVYVARILGTRSTRPKNHKFWGALHDGVVGAIDGNVPGAITLAVVIPNLRREFPGSGNGLFLVTLENCRELSYEPDDGDVVTDPREVEELAPMILSLRSTGPGVVVDCVDGGRLRLVYEEAFIALNDGTPVPEKEFLAAAHRYWSR